MSNVILSPSKISTHSKCSWVYYMNYILKFKSPGNSGSARGSVVHIIFECLLNPRRRGLFNKILLDNTVKKSPSVVELIKKLSIKNDLTEEFDNKGNHNFDLIDNMILVGLKSDFYCEGSKEISAEQEIYYKDKEGRYEFRGIIDKIAKYKNNSYKIFDYKSSSEKYKGEEKDFNLQSLIYSLWFQKQYGIIPFFRFIFLRFEGDPFIDKQYTNEELNGFEEYLIYIASYLDDFGLDKAKLNLAADKGYPTDGSFSGMLACGYGKYPGHKNKAGKEYFVCPMKFARTLYVVLDTDGQIKYSTDNVDCIKSNEWEFVKVMNYSGCPYWNRE